MERSRHPQRLFFFVSGLFLVLASVACVSPIGEEVGSPPRYRGEDDGGSDAGGSAGASAGASGKGGNGTSGKAGAGGTSAGAAGAEAGTGGASGTEAAGGSESGGTDAGGAGGAEAGGAGGAEAGGAGGTDAAGAGGSGTAGTGGSTAGMAGAGGTVVDEGPCPRVRVKNADPYANIRPDPSTGGTPIGKAYNGDIITCQGQVAGQNIEGDTNWYKLAWGSGTGYISGTLAGCTKDK